MPATSSSRRRTMAFVSNATTLLVNAMPAIMTAIVKPSTSGGACQSETSPFSATRLVTT